MNGESEDKLLLKSSISKTSVIFFWCLIPGLYLFRLVVRFVIYLPLMIKTAISNAAKEALAEQLGIDKVGLSDIYAAVGEQLTIEIPGFITAFFKFMIVILIAVWLVFCIVWTKRAIQNKLFFYENRIYAESGSDKFEAEWTVIKDVYVEQGLLGKLFKYGNITISGSTGSFTVKNIGNPQEFRRIFITNYSK